MRGNLRDQHFVIGTFMQTGFLPDLLQQFDDPATCAVIAFDKIVQLLKIRILPTERRYGFMICIDGMRQLDQRMRDLV